MAEACEHVCTGLYWTVRVILGGILVLERGRECLCVCVCVCVAHVRTSMSILLHCLSSLL